MIRIKITPPIKTPNYKLQTTNSDPYGVVSSHTPTSSTLLSRMLLPFAVTLPALKMQIAEPRLSWISLREIAPSDVFTYETPMPRLR